MYETFFQDRNCKSRQRKHFVSFFFKQGVYFCLQFFFLREVVGGDIDQQGSIMDNRRLRFDFNSEKLDIEQIRGVEEHVNSKIQENLVIYEKEVPKEVC